MKLLPQDTGPQTKKLPVTEIERSGAGRNELLQTNIRTILFIKSVTRTHCVTRKLTSCSVLTYKEKKPINHIYICVDVKQGSRPSGQLKR